MTTKFITYMKRQGRTRIWDCDFNKIGYGDFRLNKVTNQTWTGVTEYLGNNHWAIIKIDKELASVA